MDPQPVSWHVSVKYETTHLEYKCEATHMLDVKGSTAVIFNKNQFVTESYGKRLQDI